MPNLSERDHALPLDEGEVHPGDEPCCAAFPDCLHPTPRGDRDAIAEALVAPLFPLEKKVTGE